MEQDKNLEQKEKFESLLKRQELQRQAEKEEKLKTQELLNDPSENVHIIHKNFLTMVDALKLKIPEYTELDGDKDKIDTHFKEQYQRLHEVKEYVANLAFCLPTYTYQNYQQTLEELEKSISSEKDKALPKKRFAFSKKTVKKAPKAAEVKEVEDVKDNTAEEVYLTQNDLLIKDKSNTKIVIKEEDFEGKENLHLHNIDSCEIIVPCILKAFYIKNIKHSKVYGTCVSGACFVQALVDSSLSICTHQMRIHNSHNSKFYVIARSDPIIEHSDTLLFSEYNLKYEKMEDLLKKSDLWEVKNHYANVKDFNWLKKDKSPNWDVNPSIENLIEFDKLL